MNALEVVGELVLNLIAVAGFLIISVFLGESFWSILAYPVYGLLILWVYFRVQPDVSYEFNSYRPFMNLMSAATIAIFIDLARKESGWFILAPLAFVIFMIWGWIKAYQGAKENKPSLF